MKALLKLKILLLVMVCLLSTAGCQKTVIVRTSLAPIPESLNNILYVAEGEPIRIGIEGQDTYFESNVDGYLLIHKTDMIAIMRELKND